MSTAEVKGDFPFRDSDFKDIAKIAYDSFGLHLEPCKKQLVYSRLARRLRTLGLKSFKDYCAFLGGPAGTGEQRELLSALTTNVTQFFRENHHFDMLREDILPDLIKRAKRGARIRIWSAGCSAGQEPYSIALTLLNLCPDAERYDIRILGTDIDPVILQRAARAQYPSAEHTAIPAASRDAHTILEGDTFTIDDTTRRFVSFGELNLMDRWPMTGKFDVIFCRNVAIYFDADTQARLWKRFADMLVPEGHLMIGHSERISGPATANLTTCGATAYKMS